ncbi:MAG: conjugative transposon protein TraN [Paludibacteraceae bacterium]|nr:conjugative transposon protein TraN [Paludibacteraceae bacterium]
MSSCVAYANVNEKILLNEHNCVILKFDSEIKYVDFGNGEIDGNMLSSNRMLRIQGKIPEFNETTMSVVTSDGGYHQFALMYAPVIEKYVWQQTGTSYKLDSIGFSSEKTTHFICDEKITDIVPASKSIIADYADKIENIVKAKAVKPYFPQTCIHFVTESGYVYTFIVKPDVSPGQLTVILSSEEEITQSSQAIFKSNSVNEGQMKEFAKTLTTMKPFINDIGVIGLKMAFAMSSIYSYNDLLAFRIDLSNNGKIDYDIDFIKGYIRDKTDTRTTAVQETELQPVYTYYSKIKSPMILKAGESESIVLFFPKFTIPKKRILYFEVFEKNGGRHLSFPVSSREILKARAIY